MLWVKRNASTILSCVGVIGVIATAVMAVKATPKAVELLDEAKEEKGEELTKIEVVKVAAPVYIPTVIVGVSTAVCVLSASTLNKRQQAALTSAYALLNSSYKEYRGKVVELYGEEAGDVVIEEIAKDKYENTDITVSEGNQLFYDAFSGRYFESTLFKVQQAEYYLNRDLVMQDYVSLNDWYRYLGIESIDPGETLGWCGSICYEMYWQMWVDFSHKKTVMDDGLECTIINFWHEPIPITDMDDYF